MTNDSLPLAELLAKAGDGDFLRSVAEAVVQLLMETDVEGVIDTHKGLKAAIRRVMGSAWQRCRVHWIRMIHGHLNYTAISTTLTDVT